MRCPTLGRTGEADGLGGRSGIGRRGSRAATRVVLWSHPPRTLMPHQTQPPPTRPPPKTHPPRTLMPHQTQPPPTRPPHPPNSATTSPQLDHHIPPTRPPHPTHLPRQNHRHRGQEARCTADAAHPEFRPLGRCAPVAVNSGLRPETR